MSPVLAERVAALEAERAQPTPRLPKPDPVPPVSEADQARHRKDLLAAVRGTTRRTSS